ncbi:GNAT family N-acetyltransferase [Sanguibacter sp. 25GB23B1]|uniref:GNAT family N-acetyltransferase n=1 Tax=unclassified Sanguibacter TaxID=2645534 RepID=UPI0032AF5755
MTVHLEPMPATRLSLWVERTFEEYIEDRVRAGDSLDEAHAIAERNHHKLFPAGHPAPGHLIFDVLHDDLPVGFLWIGPRSDENPTAWWVWDIEIELEHRGKGWGRQVMVLAEQAAAEHGAASLGLNVFGFNTVARHLYESLGYETTSLQMAKPLTPVDPASA